MNLVHDIVAAPAVVPIDAELSLPAHFERVVAVHAMRPALASDIWQATYAELNAAANRLAHALLARGGAPGGRNCHSRWRTIPRRSRRCWPY